MKVLSIEEKAKAYDEAIKRAKAWKTTCSSQEGTVNLIEDIFPELKESEDERIRKELLEHCKNQAKPYIQTGNKCPKIQSWIDWLEKQGEQKPYGQIEECLDCQSNYAGECKGFCAMKRSEQKSTDKIEPKFHEGEWIISDTVNKDYHICKITSIKDGNYTIESIYGYKGYNQFDVFDNVYRLWTIQDAKDGDVLADEPIEGYSSSFVAIYKKQNGEDFDSYCFVGFDGKFYKGENGHSTEDIHPATKEQRDLMFQKMKEAGYEWDAEKKELKKIEHNPWSEEDETMITNIIIMLKEGASLHFNKKDITKTVDWLKSIKEKIYLQAE